MNAPGPLGPRPVAGRGDLRAAPASGGEPARPRAGPSAVVSVSLAVIAVILSLAVLREARLFAIPTVLGALLALALSPLARRLERVGLGSGPVAFLLVFGGVAALAAGLYALAPSAEAMSRQAPVMALKLERMLREIQEEVEDKVPAAAQGDADGSGEDGGDGQGDDLMSSGRAWVSEAMLGAPALAGATVYGVFLAFFLLAERARLERATLSLAPAQRHRLALARAYREVRGQVSRYLLAITVINLGLGFATAAAFWAIGMPNPAVWGAAMALLNYMPYLGPIVMNLAVLVVGATTLPNPEDALAPMAALAALNTVEGYIVTPRVVGHRVRVGALAVFFALAFGAWLWGAAGALIATPALIVIRAFVVRALSLRREQPRFPSRQVSTG